MSKITVIFRDPQDNTIPVEDIDTNITIGALREIFKQNGGDTSEGQWKINAEVINDSQKLSDFINLNAPKKPKKITIGVVNAVRGGNN